ncbi:hypothetical protein LTR85_002195 [Meristemomyces frigidus]|nr:hypothetical protein LTR85_002195 [Meristemomyces frigidus]
MQGPRLEGQRMIPGHGRGPVNGDLRSRTQASISSSHQRSGGPASINNSLQHSSVHSNRTAGGSSNTARSGVRSTRPTANTNAQPASDDDDESNEEECVDSDEFDNGEESDDSEADDDDRMKR